jgi:hypothetical protein
MPQPKFNHVLTVDCDDVFVTHFKPVILCAHTVKGIKRAAPADACVIYVCSLSIESLNARHCGRMPAVTSTVDNCGPRMGKTPLNMPGVRTG